MSDVDGVQGAERVSEEVPEREGEPVPLEEAAGEPDTLAALEARWVALGHCDGDAVALARVDMEGERVGGEEALGERLDRERVGVPESRGDGVSRAELLGAEALPEGLPPPPPPPALTEGALLPEALPHTEGEGVGLVDAEGEGEAAALCEEVTLARAEEDSDGFCEAEPLA